jgi:transmembrane sensor
MSPNSKRTPSPSRAAMKTAAEWLARRDAGLSPADVQELSSWRNASPDHERAWKEIQSAWHAFDATSQPRVAAAMLRELGARRRRRIRSYTLSAVCGVAAAVAGLVFVRRSPVPANVATASTVAESIITRPERRVLSDGSVVELNTGAEIAVNFTPARRDVRLLRGEAHFVVSKNPARPFIVTAGDVTARAVGTQFEVNRGAHSTAVIVTEGRVAVARTGTVTGPSTIDTVFLNAGARVSIATDVAARPPPQPESVSAADQDRILAWRGPRLTLSNTPLADAVAALNRENRTQITIQSEPLAQMRLSGVFRADNAEGFVRLLEESYGVKVDRQGDRVVLVDTKP